jgi:hypothetical protein
MKNPPLAKHLRISGEQKAGFSGERLRHAYELTAQASDA